MAAAMLSTAADAPAMPKVGEKAPDFTLKSQKGDTVSLHDFTGQWVVLYFYPEDMTKGCTLEAGNFQHDLPQYEALNAVIVGVSVDTVEKHQQFCTQEKLTFRLLSDPKHEVVTDRYASLNEKRVPVGALRNTFLVDPKGIIRFVDDDVQHHIGEHSGQMLAKIKELQEADAKK